MNLKEAVEVSTSNIKELPETKRSTFYLFSQLIATNKYACVILGGIRRVGKTTLLKQLYCQYDNTVYLDFQNEEIQRNFLGILDQIYTEVKDGNIKALFLDEMTKVYAYDDILKNLVSFLECKEVPIVITGSSRYHLQRMSVGVLGARSVYFELRNITYIEYLLNFSDYGKGSGIHCYYLKHYSLETLEHVKKFKEIGCSKESFHAYIKFIAGKNVIGFKNNTRDYIEACYTDLLETERSYTIEEPWLPDIPDFDLAADLLYVLQYRLLEPYSNFGVLSKDIQKYAREQYAFKLNGLGLFEGNNLETVLKEKAKHVSARTKEELVDAYKILVHCGLLKLIETIGIDSESKRVALKKSNLFYKGGLPETKSEIFSKVAVVPDVSIYLTMLQELMNTLAISEIPDDLLKGVLFGQIVEFYIVSEILAANGSNSVFKMKIDDIESIHEIDIVADSLTLLCEVGAGGKRARQLAFCNREFNEKAVDYAAFDRLLISDIDKGLMQGGYYEYSYFNFGAFADMLELGRLALQLRI